MKYLSIALLTTFILLLNSQRITGQSFKELSCSELKAKEAEYKGIYEMRRDMEIQRLEGLQDKLKSQVLDSQMDWGGAKRITQEIAMIDEDYGKIKTLRRTFWGERINAMHEYFKPLYDQCYEPRPQYTVAGVWSITQSNGYAGTLKIIDSGNGSFSGTAQFNNNLNGQIINGLVKGDQVSFRINYGSFYGDYTGIFKEGGNVIEEQAGNTQSSTGEKASWTAKRM